LQNEILQVKWFCHNHYKTPIQENASAKPLKNRQIIFVTHG